jgi:hypothetical protein
MIRFGFFYTLVSGSDYRAMPQKADKKVCLIDGSPIFQRYGNTPCQPKAQREDNFSNFN